MNSTIETKANSLTFFELTKNINSVLIIIIVIVGILCNSITVFLLVLKRKKTEASKKTSLWLRSFSSTQYYMLFLALSDLIFLACHLFEDILPSISSYPVFQLVNLNAIFCKFILTVRNAARFNSSYLIVLFAWERYVNVSMPLKRIKYLSTKNTKYIIGSVFVASLFLTSYTAIISGLRPHDDNEKADFEGVRHECDVMADYKHVYSYIIFFYILFSIILPILLISYFNITIVYMILQRKRLAFKQYYMFSKSKGSVTENLSPKLDKTSNIERITPEHSPSPNIFTSSKYSIRYTNEIIVINRKDTLDERSPEQYYSDQQKIVKMLQRSFQRFDRVSSILVVISACFVLFNIPYIIAWFNFFIPMTQGVLNVQEIRLRYGFVYLTEILHIMNFSINFFFYYLGTSWGFKKFPLCRQRKNSI